MANKNTAYPYGKNKLEWAVFGLGLILVIGILGYLGYKSMTYTTGSPQLTVEYFPDPGAFEPGRYHVIIRNKGHETAESITVVLSLRRGSTELEQTELSIDFCPKESQREGWMSFSNTPLTTDTIRARVVSYEKP